MKPRFIPRLLTLCAALSALAMPLSSRGSTINWSSDFNDLFYDAGGQVLDGNFSFEIGSFASGFVPTGSNINDWAANWKVFDRAFDPTPGDPGDGDPEGWNTVDQFYVGTAEHLITGGSGSVDANPSDTFAQGEVAYLWVYNTKNRETGTEWALVTDGSGLGDVADDWVFPDPTEPASTSYEWQLADADAAIYGGLNGTTGGGQPYTIQTSLVPVPEPGPVLLLGMAALVGLMSRRRRGDASAIG
ncbi:MAG: PEP-CTERM sorting domain-containing protein [Verrucomicrobiota bacterium]